MNITLPIDFNQTCVNESLIVYKSCYETFENEYWIFKASLEVDLIDHGEISSDTPFSWWVYPLVVILFFGVLLVIYAMIPDRQAFFEE